MLPPPQNLDTNIDFTQVREQPSKTEVKIEMEQDIEPTEIQLSSEKSSNKSEDQEAISLNLNGLI